MTLQERLSLYVSCLLFALVLACFKQLFRCAFKVPWQAPFGPNPCRSDLSGPAPADQALSGQPLQIWPSRASPLQVRLGPAPVDQHPSDQPLRGNPFRNGLSSVKDYQTRAKMHANGYAYHMQKFTKHEPA